MAVTLITGGTGSFGQAFTRYLLWEGAADDTIRVFSRDEQKQEAMKRELSDSRVRYLIGDVRDYQRVRRAMRGVDFVVHAAALKIIPMGEYNPDEMIKTNVLGSHNVIEAAIEAGVRAVLCISSDKAVSPVNLYGNTKACMEKLAVLSNNSSGDTAVSVARYGNVVGSRGSVLTILKRQADDGLLQITHADMTRFWMTLPQACDFVMRCLLVMEGGEVFIPKLPAARVEDLAVTLFPDTPVNYCGLRPGEKMHEVLSNEHEWLNDCGWAFRVDPGWFYGTTPLCSKDAVIPAADLLSRDEYAMEVRRAAHGR